MAKFKDETTEEEIERLIKGYANLANIIQPMKSFHWGNNVSIENFHQGFTHLFDSTLESLEGVKKFLSHPTHVDFANDFLPSLEKYIVFDYKPTTVNL